MASRSFTLFTLAYKKCESACDNDIGFDIGKKKKKKITCSILKIKGKRFQNSKAQTE